MPGTSGVKTTRVVTPDWAAPCAIRAFTSTRLGGASAAPFDALNLGLHVGDRTATVTQNRRSFAAALNLPQALKCPRQVHGTRVIDASALAHAPGLEADAVYTDQAKQVCAILTADCLPILLSNKSGTEVAAIHAGWRGLFDNIISAALARCAAPPSELVAWIGPAISAENYPVGDDLREQFCNREAHDSAAFQRINGIWHADLYLLAERRLRHAGVREISCYTGCTFGESTRFYSYRRDGETGRMASVIWIDATP